MKETTMPAAEVAMAPASESEAMSYEFAFHVLPTVAEGEVESVYSDLKTLVTKHKGEVFDEEAPKRFDLAYEIEKPLEGKNRKFKSAYFGWVRFKADPSVIEELTKDIDSHKQLLRYLIIRLTKLEEEHPFRFHESLETKKVTDIEDGEVISEQSDEPVVERKVESEEKEDVDEDALEEALKKKEV